MKRSLADTSARSTAGCLPVPLFNQKKRNRQPFTSNPLQNEPGTSSGTWTYNFSATSLGWGTANPEVAATESSKQWVVSSSQLKMKEKPNLRIISAVIESMKHWTQYAHKTALLFEVLGTLDSAVAPGAYGAKYFLLRDGKEILPCVFYEIDRDLPRLIRGRVHRCMGTYDTKWNLFKCVSVRPATTQEQNTFQDFVKIADVAMTAYVKNNE
ncbi:LOW QUALITY PROTEIN: spermatogenesis-associated protein 22 [Athene cunicularia]|uniref:LOW QUALITY PROTEIN: spermatogenesis-associated protein 22 n=1 Tax=Athene cunicularia TaxID=194338 RepID=UPI000EF73149|nr:LOW QUALITY PROTEIN: spermatogenesis-associated protein 22 [Athene cunicularia]